MCCALKHMEAMPEVRLTSATLSAAWMAKTTYMRFGAIVERRSAW